MKQVFTVFLYFVLSLLRCAERKLSSRVLLPRMIVRRRNRLLLSLNWNKSLVSADISKSLCLNDAASTHLYRRFLLKVFVMMKGIKTAWMSLGVGGPRLRVKAFFCSPLSCRLHSAAPHRHIIHLTERSGGTTGIPSDRKFQDG